MPVMFWNPTLADERIMERAVEKLDEIAETMAREIRKEIMSKGLVGTVSRPMYRSGPYAGKYWTARDAGSMLRSVRIVKKNENGNLRSHNVWIMVGNRKVYYAKMVEHYTPFFRPAINRSKRVARQMLAAA
jgi:hypothetical protein